MNAENQESQQVLAIGTKVESIAHELVLNLIISTINLLPITQLILSGPFRIEPVKCSLSLTLAEIM